MSPNSAALTHFARISETRPVTGSDILDFAAAREGARLIREESERFDRFSVMDVSERILGTGVRVLLLDETAEVEHEVFIDALENDCGRSWSIDVVKPRFGLAARIESWLERERRKSAREVWDGLRKMGRLS